MQALLKEIDSLRPLRRFGRVARIEGLLVEVTGAAGAVSLGGQVSLTCSNSKTIPCEVVGFREGRAQVMPLGTLDGVSLGARADFDDRPALIYPSRAWLGRVLDAFAHPVDGKGPLALGAVGYPIKAQAPSAHSRARIGGKLDLGIKALNAFVTCCRGQRMGIFSGSGVGKSTLLAMLARNTNADAIVIGLVGERGRELKDFIEDDLGADGLKRSVVVAATSDEPALVRRQAAYVAVTIAEQLRDEGLHVLLLMDSVTRFAMAQREVGLSAGEPPATKGYTPTVFAELPRLLERAGPGAGGSEGSITGLFTVLVEGDDHNEPIADAVRGILDGHIVLDRAIAERGRFPAINVLKSVSRVMPQCNSDAEQELVLRARSELAIYENMAELVRLGAYKSGTSAEVDQAIALYPPLEAFLTQKKSDRVTLAEGYEMVERIFAGRAGKGR
ncbi:MAG TPA: flagellar protein export ATPase FliI [Rhizomicrobium sp.]|nr:flagellar protein export ATPase FliI [Rhizomicrobium sp.]